MNEEYFVALGRKVEAARLERRWSVEQAARKAEISRTTWNRVEQGLGVQDVKRAAVLGVLGLDHNGDPVSDVGGDAQDSAGYVRGPGAKVEGGASEDEVLGAIAAMRRDMQEMERRLSERLGKLEEPGP